MKLSAGNGWFDATHVGHSADAGVVVYETAERLTPADSDDRSDLYLRSATGMVKVTPGNGPYNPEFHGISKDGAAVVFSTLEALTGDDTDERGDVYRWRGGRVQRISTGPLGGNANDAAVGADAHSGIVSGWVQLVADDARRIAFWTSERLTPDDTDQSPDAYAWTPAGAQRVSTGPSGGNGVGTAMVAGASRDARRVVFGTNERITQDDRDDHYDLFERARGVTRRITTGPAGGNGAHGVACLVRRDPCPSVAFVSADASAIFFTTDERLVREDVDDAIDVYRRAGGETILLSPARPGRPSEDAWFVDAAEDGSIAYLQTEERLTADDRNERTDGYRVRLPLPLVTARPRAHPAGPPPPHARDRRRPAGASHRTAATPRLTAARARSPSGAGRGQEPPSGDVDPGGALHADGMERLPVDVPVGRLARAARGGTAPCGSTRIHRSVRPSRVVSPSSWAIPAASAWRSSATRSTG